MTDAQFMNEQAYSDRRIDVKSRRRSWNGLSFLQLFTRETSINFRSHDRSSWIPERNEEFEIRNFCRAHVLKNINQTHKHTNPFNNNSMFIINNVPGLDVNSRL